MTENKKSKQELADNKEMDQDFPSGSDIELVDASLLVQESGHSHENQNGPLLSRADDKTLGLPSEAHLSHNQVLPCESNDKATNDVNMLDAGHNELLENKGNSGNTQVQNQVEAASPLPCGEAVTSKIQDENLEKKQNCWTDLEMAEADESGTIEEQVAFMNELESFHKENALEYKPPKFYGEPLNCLKLWRSVIRLGGYELVTATKLWRQVGESFHPPKTCTTVSWTFRIFYEKALLEYEKHKTKTGELQLPVPPILPSASVEREGSGFQTPSSGRQRRDSAARAMHGWHSQRNLYGEDKTFFPISKREKHIKTIGIHKHKTSTNLEHADKSVYTEADTQLEATVVDVGPPADWVKINVHEAEDCYEVYALVPGLLREEVRVQSDPAGRLVITGQPEQRNNPWGITPFKKVVNLPARIDPLQTTAVVSLHGRLSVRVPFEQEST